MSVTSRPSSARALPASAGSRVPMTGSARRAPATRTLSGSPHREPERARGRAADISAVPGRRRDRRARRRSRPRSASAARYGRNGASANGIHAQDAERAPGVVRRRHVALHHRRGRGARPGRRRRRAIEGLAASPAGPPTIWWVARPVTASVASAKARQRARVGEVDGHHHRHAQRDAEHGEADAATGGARRCRRLRTPGERPAHAPAATRCSTSCAAARWRRRGRRTPTTSRLCVTITTVLPGSRASASSRSSTGRGGRRRRGCRWARRPGAGRGRGRARAPPPRAAARRRRAGREGCAPGRPSPTRSSSARARATPARVGPRRSARAAAAGSPPRSAAGSG